jgi:hypothetical protein
MDVIKPETVNACWWNLWSEYMNKFKGFPTTDNWDALFRWPGKVECNAFAHILKEETEELWATKKQWLTKNYRNW